MSIFFQYDNENGTVGNVLTPALSGYSAMTGTDPTYDNAYAADGTKSALYTLSGNSSIQNRAVPGGVIYWRRYFKFDSGPPSASSAVVAIYDTNGVQMGSVRILNTGAVQLRSATLTQIQNSSHTVVAGDELRLEYHPVVGGTSQVRLFWNSNKNGTTPDETLSGSNGTAGTGTITEFREGSIAAATWTFHADATAADNAAYAAPLGGGGPATYGASGTVPVFSNTIGNPTVIQAVPEETPSLTTQIFKGLALAANGTGLLTNPARWGWSPTPYDQPNSGSFTPEGQGMRLVWDSTPGTVGNGYQVGRFVADVLPLIPGHRIKLKVVVNVPVGSPDVALVNPFTDTQSEWMTVKDRDVELVLFFTWDVGRNPMFGIVAPTGTGSVLVKRVTFCDNSSGAGSWEPVGGTVLPPPPPVDTTAPTTPGTPTASITNLQVSLAWTASTDAVGVDHYELHRSGTTGFTPNSGTLIASPPGNSWVDNTPIAGTYYYKVIAVDAANNKSAASGQRSAVTTTPAVSNIKPGISTQQNFGGITGWKGYRVYSQSRLNNFTLMTGAGAGQTVPEFMAYSKQGAPFSGSYASIFASVTADLNTFYYTGGAGSQTHSSRWDIDLYWSNGNEMYDKGMLANQTPANIALFVESQRALYDACHQIDGTTGQRRFPRAKAGSNPVHSVATQTGNLVKPWLIPSARYHDFVMWSTYPPGRQGNGAGGIPNETDPTFNWPSYDAADRYDNQLGYLYRTFAETSEARAQARIDTNNPSFEIEWCVGETGIASDPDDLTTRPYFFVFGVFGAAATLSAQFNLPAAFICYWDNWLGGASDPHTMLSDEGTAGDHERAGGSGTPNPSTAVACRDWTSYHPSFGGTKPGSWSANPKASWRFTGTQL